MKHLLIYNLLIISNYSLVGMENNILKNRYENSIYKVMKKSAEENNILVYKKCMAKLLPHGICKQIDATYAFLHNEKIKKSFTKNIVTTGRSDNTDMPKLIINNNGHYCAHNISVVNSGLRVHSIEDNAMVDSFLCKSHKPLYFSPDNKCYIVKEDRGSFFYDINERSRHWLLDEQCIG